MKRYTKILVCIVFSIAAVLLSSLGYSHAEDRETTVNIREACKDGVFNITWENTKAKAKVVITDPNGKVFSAAKTPDVYYEEDGLVIIYIDSVAAGDWKIKVTGNNLGSINAEFGRMPGAMNIDSFTVSGDMKSAVATLSVSDSEPEVYVEIYADTDNIGYDGDRVYAQNADPNGKFDIDLSGLYSGEYHFYAVLSKDGIWTRAYADGFISYQNEKAEKKVNACGGTYNDGYYLRWDFDENESRNYTVRVWDEDHSLIATEELRDENFYYGEFDEDQAKVYMAVSYSNENCKYDLIEAVAGTGVDAKVDFDVEGSNTNQKYINAKVDFEGEVKVIGYIDGEEIIQDDKPGTYRISLDEGNNSVIIELTDKNGNMEDFVKNISLDSYPPHLAISEDINGKTVRDDYIYISGYSEIGAKLTLNGKEITMKQGFFNEKIDLVDGDNTITLEAADAAGNISSYRAVVNRNNPKEKKEKLSWIVAGVVLIVLLVIYGIIFVKGIRRKKR